MFEGLEIAEVDTGEARIFIRTAGSGPGLLLLHGFPQTHLMWRDVAQRLAGRFGVVPTCAATGKAPARRPVRIMLPMSSAPWLATLRR